ncbi:MAG TPA: hypothetical protein VIL46_04095 [Gemmataceae bacterium]
MTEVRTRFAVLLVERGIVRDEQLREAEACRTARTDPALAEAVIALGYAERIAVLRTLAEALGLPFIDLREVEIPAAVIELVPESVARENLVLPLALEGNALQIAVFDPADSHTLQKLQFILNKVIRPVLAERDQLREAINRHYGEVETESVDSMLSEFTDTAIDFDECPPAPAAPREGRFRADRAPQEPAAPEVSRRANVRYYDRMNPERMFPLLVVLSRGKLAAVAKRHVSQAAGDSFRVELGARVEVEPILPGCDCYPRRERVRVGEGDATATFWVVPRVLGRVMHARVVVRRGGNVLAEVPLEVRVRRKTLAVLLGAMSLLLPLVMVVLRQFRLDLESQMNDGFPLFATALSWLMRTVSPEALAGMLLLPALVAYLAVRPRKRDVFWDLRTEPGTGEAEPERPRRNPRPRAPEGWLARGRRYLARKRFRAALRCYEEGLRAEPAEAADFARAALAAWQAGEQRRALEILRQAEARLGRAGMTGPMWYNMGCFAARLGLLSDALAYLNRAVDAGYTDPQKFLTDPDLAPLRDRRGFRSLIASIDE